MTIIRLFRVEHASRHLGPCLDVKRCRACVEADRYLEHVRLEQMNP